MTKPTVVKSGSALIIDTPDGWKLQVQLNTVTKKAEITVLQQPAKDDLEYMFEKDEQEEEGE